MVDNVLGQLRVRIVRDPITHQAKLELRTESGALIDSNSAILSGLNTAADAAQTAALTSAIAAQHTVDNGTYAATGPRVGETSPIYVYGHSFTVDPGIACTAGLEFYKTLKTRLVSPSATTYGITGSGFWEIAGRLAQSILAGADTDGLYAKL